MLISLLLSDCSVDGKYVPQGKLGCALLGSHSSKDVGKPMQPHYSSSSIASYISPSPSFSLPFPSLSPIPLSSSPHLSPSPFLSSHPSAPPPFSTLPPLLFLPLFLPSPLFCSSPFFSPSSPFSSPFLLAVQTAGVHQ